MSYLLTSRSIAVISETFNPHQVGGRVLLNLQKSKYQGRVYPVTSEFEEIFGMKTFPNLNSIPEEVITVVITLPPKSVLPILEECVEKKVKFIMIPSTDVIESEDEKFAFEQLLKTFTEETDIRILGPDCSGVFNIVKSIGISGVADYEPNWLQNGKISLITQGEGLGRAVLDANDLGIGFNYWISTGNEVDLETADFIQYFSHDVSTQVILVIIEKLKDKWKFQKAVETARRFGKPLIVLHIGQVEEEISTKEELNNNKQVHSDFFKELDIIQVYDLDELLNVGWLFYKYGHPQGNRIGIFSYSNGVSALLAEKCRQANLPVPDITDETKSIIQDFFPNIETPTNPINMKIYVYQDMSDVSECLEQFTNDPNVDIVFVLYSYKLGIYTEMLVRHIIKLAQRVNKPIIPLWLSLSGELEVSYEILKESGLPFYSSANAGVSAIKHFTDYHMKMNRLNTLM
ncbi:CoA-binding protein [Peribacillus asahii]|uniref:CoA-binding protein n=1 Tax=Peribacillus asahii TaxID=228899 RepID=UPI00207B02ED|nr:CoA-binding protein [Peribacillus asahii]USK72064.1 CoA-binding protein [Peribacillus asahii]